MEFAILFSIVAGVVFYIFYSNKQKEKKGQEARALIQHKTFLVQKYFKGVNDQKQIPTVQTSILLKKGEKAYLVDNVQLFETRSVSISERVGGAVRITKGLYVGKSYGTSRSHDEVRAIDAGKLILTNKRLIFDGTHSSKDYKIEKIMSVQEYSDGIEVASEGKVKSQLYIGMYNPYQWKALIEFVHAIPESGELPHATLEIS